MSETYFETLHSAVDHSLAQAQERGVLLLHTPAVWETMCREHLAYGQVRTGDFEIEHMRGKPTKKYFHVVITRLDSGRYELVTYVL